MIAPKDESKSLVLDWLNQQGLANKTSVSTRGNTVIVKASVSEIETLLKAKYDTFSKCHRPGVVPDSYHVPIQNIAASSQANLLTMRR